MLGDVHPTFMRVVHPIFLALAGLFVLRGVLAYLDRPLPNAWVFFFGLAIAWVFCAAGIPSIGVPLLVLVPRLTIGLSYLWISVHAASRPVSNFYKGSRMIGIVFILWGALSSRCPGWCPRAI